MSNKSNDKCRDAPLCTVTTIEKPEKILFFSRTDRKRRSRNQSDLSTNHIFLFAKVTLMQEQFFSFIIYVVLR